jgi:hypothetical protein
LQKEDFLTDEKTFFQRTDSSDVMPAQAGIQAAELQASADIPWMPDSAGTTDLDQTQRSWLRISDGIRIARKVQKTYLVYLRRSEYGDSFTNHGA